MPDALKEIFYKYPRALVRVVFIILNNVYCLPTYVIWMVMLMPLKRCNPDMYYRIEGFFFHWLLSVVTSWSWSAGYNIIEQGDDITACISQPTLVIANHQSTADVPLLMAAFNPKKNVLPNIMWIMDRLFKFTNFGVVSVMHQDFFISAGKTNRDDSLNQLKAHLLKSYIPRRRHWMVLFPEGGFLRKRREVSQRFAQKNNYPVLQYVTLPRVGALKAIVDTLCPIANNNSPPSTIVHNGSQKEVKKDLEERQLILPNHLEYILDITIGYPNARPLDMPTICLGLRPECDTHILYRLIRCADIPKDTDSLTAWLYDRYVEKEKLLDEFYRTGQFRNMFSLSIYRKTNKRDPSQLSKSQNVTRNYNVSNQ